MSLQSSCGCRSAARIVLAAVLWPLSVGLRADSAPATQPATSSQPELLQPDGQAKMLRPFDPTDAYELRQIDGWPVRVNKKLLSQEPDLAQQTLDLLHCQLAQIPRAVPATAVDKLRTVTIWVELDDPLFPCMCYHPDAGWVRGHGLNPQKTKGVEMSNPRHFLAWDREQPWMVLHELAHAYHDQFLPRGFENEPIAAAYESARASGVYDAILRINGHIERHYAMTNPMEYFAECSEAFFGVNDFYPFVRAELARFDPKGYAKVAAAWGAQATLLPPAGEAASQPAAP